MKRVIICRDTLLELLRDMLSVQHGSNTLVVCSSKSQFWDQLTPLISGQQPVQEDPLADAPEDEQTSEGVQPHTLLDPTLELISTSKATKLAFCPTIDTLRAYLSSFAPADRDMSHPRGSLLIMDLIFLHHATSEFSVQGLMRTLASAVEAAARNLMDLQLCECSDVRDLQNPHRGPRLWDTQIPLLSGSVRLRAEEAGWSGRIISVRSIVGRWFEFEKKERPQDEEINEDEEMLV
jgi:hypothetical protein